MTRPERRAEPAGRARLAALRARAGDRRSGRARHGRGARNRSPHRDLARGGRCSRCRVCGSEADLSRLAADLTAVGAEFLVQPCDVRDAVVVDSLVRDALDRFGAVDIAVANAGVLGPLGPIDASDASQWADVLAVNVVGTAAVLRVVLPIMRARGDGRIVTLSGAGIGGPQALTNVSAYVASKAAVVALDRSGRTRASDRADRKRGRARNDRHGLHGFGAGGRPGTRRRGALRRRRHDAHGRPRTVARRGPRSRGRRVRMARPGAASAPGGTPS